MRTVAKSLLLAVLFLSLTGCGVTGRWELQSIKPETARAHFNLESMCLMKDGTFKSWARENGQEKVMTGTWKYEKPILTFISEGHERSYNAKVTFPVFGKMHVSGTAGDQAWTAELKKGGKCPPGCCESDANKSDAKKADKDSKKSDPAKVNMKTDGTCPSSGKPCDPKACPKAKAAQAQKADQQPAEEKK